ncbi:MAG TPA: hypothetical protein VGZ25_00865 [Gemmataceae bacterium]|nr:hypothetical protein [Gemmataceae bacterium]
MASARLCRRIGVGLVWMAAAMSIVAAVPSSVCACLAPGPIQAAPSTELPNRPCACQCCGDTSSADNSKRSCCSQSSTNRGSDGPTQGQNQSPCKKTIVAGQTTYAPESPILKFALTFLGLLPVDAFASLLAHPSPIGQYSPWSHSLHGPPADLVTLFQHFLI